MISPPEATRVLERAGGTVVILAPTANDARLTAEFLRSSGMASTICRTSEEVGREINERCGCILLAEEALQKETIQRVVEALDRQPSWSDIPTVIVASGGEATRDRLRHLSFLGPGGNISILERPFRPDTLVSAIAVALKARARQYEVRDLLNQLGEARDKAETASRAKDDFLATLSHELRTPLSPILLLASEGVKNPAYPNEVRASFGVIQKNVNLEARLIDDLLDLTRITRGKLQLEKVVCDLHEIIEEAMGSVQGDAAVRRVRLVSRCKAGRTQVIGDPVRLQQIIWNVLRNAVKFSPEGGEVIIETRNERADRIRVNITDFGIGIPKSELEEIFNAFSQGGHASTPGKVGYPGLGLGLSIARMLTALHAGTIRARSDGPGKGAVFEIDFPVTHVAPADAAEKRAEVSRVADVPSARRRILLVEDHRDTLQALSMLLGMHYDIVAAGTAREARAQAHRSSFDLVISDIGLPDETGYSLMKFLNKTYRLRGFALSGYGTEADIARSREAGFVGHLTKPIEWSPLQRALADFFANPDCGNGAHGKLGESGSPI
jgi:signal transduction histidine kinase/ActR/RegA family two-component response regulator